MLLLKREESGSRATNFIRKPEVIGQNFAALMWMDGDDMDVPKALLRMHFA
jgi:hypothetical protein